jgi:hypothetical protein
MTRTATMHPGQFGRPILSKDGRTITVHIPITMRHQGGRKQVVTNAGAISGRNRKPKGGLWTGAGIIAMRPTSVVGQTEKHSAIADVFRSSQERTLVLARPKPLRGSIVMEHPCKPTCTPSTHF